MALSRTVLTAAIAIGDTSITVLNATGATPGATIQVDAEFMQVMQSYQSGLVIPVLRGRNGSASLAHPTGAAAIIGLAVDFTDPPAQSAASVNLPANRVREFKTLSTGTGQTLPLPKAGTDLVIFLAGAGPVVGTLPAPGKDNDGDFVFLASQGNVAHVITVAGGINGVAASDVNTFAAQQTLLTLMACNEKWLGLPTGITVT